MRWSSRTQHGHDVCVCGAWLVWSVPGMNVERNLLGYDGGTVVYLEK